MNDTLIRTRSEQVYDNLVQIERPLTDEESDQLRRASHAIEVRNWRLAQMEDEANSGALSEFDRHNEDLLRKVQREARPR